MASRAPRPEAHAEAQALATFSDQVYQDVLVRAETDGDEEFLENAFTGWMLETIADAGEIDDEWYVAHHQVRGTKANGYGISATGETLILVVTEFTGEHPPRSVTRTEVETGFRRLRAFLAKALAGDLARLEESSPGFEMIDQIRAWRPALDRVRLYFLTNGLTPGDAIDDEEVEGLPVVHHVWDLQRAYRLLTSGQLREPVEADFSKLPGGGLPFLEMPGSSDEYSAYLMMIPGDVLADVYDRYGTRVLERNVRGFLQFRGKVNKAIRETIVHSPDRFLAYNNGIAATGAEVSVSKRPDGTRRISKVKDFQIVNGGQTTAAIYHARRRDKADVSKVTVQAKLSVVASELLDDLVPVISRFANSQNKVSEADFSANDPFHVAFEELSRTVWTPPRPGQQRQTRWFYERARGQYAEAQARAGTPAQQRQFKLQHPPQQRFTKTDLAKYENSWLQAPHFVARAAEKNFREFTMALKKRGGPALVTETYFQHVIAKAILFREAERLITLLDLGGYRSQIVTYSIAYLSHATAMRLDLDAIWRAQTLPDGVRDALNVIAPEVKTIIWSAPGGQNPAEWCKKEMCWKAVSQLQVALPKSLKKCLTSGTHHTAGDGATRIARDDGSLPAPGGKNSIEVLTPEDEEAIAAVSALSPQAWFALSAWAKQTNNLQGWQRGIAYSIGQRAGWGRKPSAKQARQGVIILEEARRLGFRPEDVV